MRSRTDEWSKDRRKNISDCLKFTWGEHIKFMNGSIALTTGSFVIFLGTILSDFEPGSFDRVKGVVWLLWVGFGILFASLAVGIFWRWVFHVVMDREVLGQKDDVMVYLRKVGTADLPYSFKEPLGKRKEYMYKYFPYVYFISLAAGWVCILVFVAIFVYRDPVAKEPVRSHTDAITISSGTTTTCVTQKTKPIRPTAPIPVGNTAAPSVLPK